MCGIIGYIGDTKASPILVEALSRMEYRGYDSAGIATYDGTFIIKKGVGRVSALDEKLHFLEMQGFSGIGHTRWATHGGVCEENAHPHWSCKAEVIVAHNGIIENYLKLKDFLVLRGHKFKSQTDTEIIAHLLEESIRHHKDMKAALLSIVGSLKGSYAFLAMIKDYPDVIIGARKDAPLIVGLGRNEFFLASDVLGFINRTNQAIFLDNKEIAFLTRTGPEFMDFSGKPIVKSPTTLAWEMSSATKKEYLHFTLKEIHEQPVALHQTLCQEESEVLSFVETIKDQRRDFFITGCGSSFHAGLVLKYLLARNARMRSDVFLSSEIEQQKSLIDENSTILAISQSGETADVLNAVAAAKHNEAKVLSIVNVMSSSLARESHKVIHTRCGPEIGVAATKSFTTQLAMAYLIALTAGQKSTTEIFSISSKLEETMEVEDTVRAISEKYLKSNDYYYIGKGDHFPLAYEGALKMKELSYVHAEGMAAGELKHGALALIEQGTPVVVLNPQDDTYVQTLNNANELKSRGARIIGISTVGHASYDDYIQLPLLEDRQLYPILEAVPLQMLAYYTAVGRKLDPDYPRNLAKSVTVV